MFLYIQYILKNILNVFGIHDLLVTPLPSHPPTHLPTRKAHDTEQAITFKPFSLLHQCTHQKHRAV